MTNTDRLTRVLRAFVPSARLVPSAAAIAGGARFQLEGQVFRLLHDAARDADLCVIHGELGAPPAGSEASTYELLLRSNTLLAGNFGPLFGMQIDKPDLLMLLNLPIAPLTADFLHAALLRMAQAAKVWRASKGFSVPIAADPALAAEHASQNEPAKVPG